jgi:hypothetical protein
MSIYWYSMDRKKIEGTYSAMGLFSTIREPAFCLVNMLTGFITPLQSEKQEQNNLLYTVLYTATLVLDY